MFSSSGLLCGSNCWDEVFLGGGVVGMGRGLEDEGRGLEDDFLLVPFLLLPLLLRLVVPALALAPGRPSTAALMTRLLSKACSTCLDRELSVLLLPGTRANIRTTH